MDYYFRELGEVAYNFKMSRAGKVVARGTGFLPFNGVYTGISDSISLSLNQRNSNTDNGRAINISLYFAGYETPGALGRRVLTSGLSYEEALEELQSTDLVAPCYYILGGKTEGSVITRERTEALLTRYIDQYLQWYLV